jgi:hypothetical protein
VRKIFLLCLVLVFTNKLLAIDINADLFTYDEAKIETEFADLNKLESYLELYPETSFDELVLKFPELTHSLKNENSWFSNMEVSSPGKIPSFWFAFTLSAIGTYFIYGVVAGPISIGIVYFSSDKDKTEVKKAFWGCLTGTLLGAGIKYAMLKL